jgi:mannose/cellobiose epimerase-like protein (N-acyl-D-glucosamine 2-epimerase family)
VNPLARWLIRDAYPCWWSRGIDRTHGGFHESLRLDGAPSGEMRRARLYPRQIYAFSVAGDLGWEGPALEAVRHGLQALIAQFRRPDGLYRTLVTARGAPLMERAVLYDQAFVLLGFAAAHKALASRSAHHAAHELRSRLHDTLRNPLGGFKESACDSMPLSSNSHMHLLEACLEWMEQDEDREWSELAEEIVELALLRFHDPARGFIREYFATDGTPIPGAEADVVEPGHQYEWAWLLLRWTQRVHNPRALQLALSLIDRTERRGVDPTRNVAMNALFGDGSVRDAQARLWPQTERIKALYVAGAIAGQPCYTDAAGTAVGSLMKYLDTPTRGLWRDTMDLHGAFIEQPAPASSFYHIVSAVRTLSPRVKSAATVEITKPTAR